MDTEKCKVFLTVVETGSFSAAAAKRGYTPAGVSYTVDAIEKELGFPLLVRTHGGVTLTRAGERVLPLIKELVRTSRRIEKQAKDINTVLWGEVTIGSFPSIAMRFLPTLISEFRKQYPDVTIRLQEGVHPGISRMLANGEVDFILCSRQPGLDFEWIPLRRDQMCCILPYGHPLADSKSVVPMQLMGEDLIVPGGGKDPDVIALLERFHINANIKYTTVETDTAYAMMEKGLGVVVANELTLENRQPQGVKLPFDPPQFIEEGIYIPDLDGAAPAVRAFVEYLRGQLAALDPEGSLAEA